jgi:hypothetical protein
MRDNKAHAVWTKFARLPSIFVHTCFVKKKKIEFFRFIFLFFFFFFSCGLVVYVHWTEILSNFDVQIVDNLDNKYKKALMGPTRLNRS